MNIDEDTIEKIQADIEFEKQYIKSIRRCEDDDVCFYKNCTNIIDKYFGIEPYCIKHFKKVKDEEML